MIMRIFFFFALSLLAGCRAFRQKLNLFKHKTDINSHVDFFEKSDSHVYLVQLEDVPEDVTADQIATSFVGPNEKGNLKYLNTRVAYKHGLFFDDWYVVDFTVKLRQPVKPFAVPQVSRDRVYVRDPMSPNMIRRYGYTVHEHEDKLMFEDDKGSWLLTVVIPREMLGTPRVNDDWTEESVSYRYPDDIGESVHAYEGKTKSLGLPFSVTRKVHVLKPPKEFQPTRLEKMGLK